MMEGVGSEAASLAAHLRLGNLCWIYDSNHITIEGNTALAFTEDVAGRFLAYGWHVQRVSDANDRERVAEAITVAKRIDDRPSLIIIESHIGYGAPHKQDTSGAHGEPLGEAESSWQNALTDGPKTRNFSCRKASTSISRGTSALAGQSSGPNGWRCSSATGLHIRSSPISASGCSGAISRTGGTGVFRCFRRIRRASLAAHP